MKRIVCLLLMLVLLIALAGCAQKQETVATEVPVTDAPATEAPAAETEAPAAETEAPAAETEAPAAETEAPAAETETLSGSAAEPTEAPAEEAKRNLLVTVNGDEIWSDDTYLANTLQYYLAQIGSDDEESVAIAQQYAMNYTIMIGHLASSKAKELGLDTITDEEKAQFEAEGKATWDEIIESYIPQLNSNINENSTEEEKAS